MSSIQKVRGEGQKLLLGRETRGKHASLDDLMSQLQKGVASPELMRELLTQGKGEDLLEEWLAVWFLNQQHTPHPEEAAKLAQLLKDSTREALARHQDPALSEDVVKECVRANIMGPLVTQEATEHIQRAVVSLGEQEEVEESVLAQAKEILMIAHKESDYFQKSVASLTDALLEKELEMFSVFKNQVGGEKGLHTYLEILIGDLHSLSGMPIPSGRVDEWLQDAKGASRSYVSDWAERGSNLVGASLARDVQYQAVKKLGEMMMASEDIEYLAGLWRVDLSQFNPAEVVQAHLFAFYRQEDTKKALHRYFVKKS